MNSSGEGRDLIEQLLEEYLGRWRRGESPALEEYLRRIPGDKEAAAAFFTTALEVEQAARGVTVTADASIPLPAKVGRFQVLERIGAGGMGVVYKAVDPNDGQTVAIKLLRAELAANPRARKRFLGEARAAAAIKSEHVIRIREVAQIPQEEQGVGEPFLVMEYVQGKSLKRRLEMEPPLELVQILRIGMQIAAGLASAHEQGIVHRDIKPANILLENGVERAKITDFGLAIRLQPSPLELGADHSKLTRSYELLGTFQYMSPEQTYGKRLGPQSDLFSLGAVLYEMCADQSPFACNDLFESIRRIRQRPPRPLEQLRPGLPPALIALIEQLLQKDPRHRPPGATEVAETLRSYLADIQAGRPLPVPKLRRSRRVAMVGAGVLAMAVLATTLTAMWRPRTSGHNVDSPAQDVARPSSPQEYDNATALAVIARHGGKITGEAVQFRCSPTERVDGELGQALRCLRSPGALAFLDCNLIGVGGLEGLTAYNFLWLNHCPYLTSLQGLAGSGFQRVQVSDCDSLQSAAGVGELTGLESLELRACDRLADFSELPRLRQLKQLYLELCTQLDDFQWLRGMVSLHTLYVNSCPGLRHTQDFSTLLGLEELDLSRCENLTSVEGLKGLARLRYVNLAGCSALSKQDIQALRAALPQAKIVTGN